MKRFLAPLVGLLIAAVLVPVAAQANVPRYQIANDTLTVTLSPSNVHYYNIVVSPCDGSFTGMATSAGVNGGFESIVGTLVGGNLTFTATYLVGNTNPSVQVPGYYYTYSGPLAGGTAYDFNYGLPFSPSFTIANTLTHVSDSTYANHGDYVSSTPQGSAREDAAHSCIGMPIQSSG